MQIYHKLLFIVAGITISSILFSTVINNELSQIATNSSELADVSVTALVTLYKMQQSLQHGVQESLSYIVISDENEKDLFYKDMENFDRYVEDLRTRFSDDSAMQERLDNLVLQKNELVSLTHELFTQHEENTLDQVTIAMYEDSTERLLHSIDNFIEEETNRSHNASVVIGDKISSSQNFVYFVSVFTTIGIVAIGFLFSRHISNQIKHITSLEKKIVQHEENSKNEKLATIGQLASRLAHDLRNPLSIIQCSTDLIEMKYAPKDPAATKCLANMRRAIDRMSHQINDVMDFVRTKPLDVSKIKIRFLIDEIILGVNKPQGVQIDIDCDEDLIVTCDKRKMEVVLVNLIVNAIDAVGEKGKITVHAYEDKNDVIISVEDSGPGIPRELMNKIFDPLITTKEKGTGLGLASCFNIIKQHGGTITAYNNPTRFMIRLKKNLAEFVCNVS